MKRLLTTTFIFYSLFSFISNLHASIIKSSLGNKSITLIHDEKSPYDAQVEYIGIIHNANDIKIKNIEWDSFSCSIMIPSIIFQTYAYPDLIGGQSGRDFYNRIALVSGKFRGSRDFMGPSLTNIDAPLDRFFEIDSPSPNSLKWTIDKIEYEVPYCKNPGGTFGFFRSGTDAKAFNVYLKYVKLFKNNNLVAYFIPVRIGNVGYFYETISNFLYTNTGGIGLIIGPDL